MIKIEKLNEKNIGLAFSCAGENDIWGSECHTIANDFLIQHLDSGFEAYGITFDSKPVGHSVLVPAALPFSPVKADRGMFINCIYIAPQYRNRDLGTLLIDYIENDMNERNIHVLFAQTTQISGNQFSFYSDKQYREIFDDGINQIYMKSFSDSDIDYKIIDLKPRRDDDGNYLKINYSPLCPVLIMKYRELVDIVKKEIPGIEIQENFIESEKDMKENGNFGVFFDNIPLLISTRSIGESVNIIKGLTAD
ncbi:MAG: GNAT family N-acetyltransferase [bacterium]